jgi:hypothetical protein
MTDIRSSFSNAFALVIGIAEYANIRTLPRVDDVADFAALLQDPDHCGYRPDHVCRLLDAEATGVAIRSELSRLAATCDKESTVIVYFSGHGGQIQSGPQAGEYLLPVDTVYPSGDDLARTALHGSEFTKMLNQIPARKSFVIFDCCHAGGIGDTRHLTLASPMRPGLSTGFYEALLAGRGRAILAACRANEVSYVLPNAKYGLFTEHLLNGLRGGASSEDGVIRVFDLFGYVQPRVTQIQPGQHPYFKFEGEENLPISLYRGGIRGHIEKVDADFRYHAYVCFADREPDAGYVWKTLVPQLKAAGMRIAVSNDSEDGGVDRVVDMQRGVEQAKRTIVVLSEAYIQDHLADFVANLAIYLGVEEGKYRLLPVKIDSVDRQRLPLRIRQLVLRDLSHPYRAEDEWKRLIEDLRRPIPIRGG